MAQCICKVHRRGRWSFYHVNRRDPAYLPFLDVLEQTLELDTLGMDDAPSLGKRKIILIAMEGFFRQLSLLFPTFFQ
jgi:hypothetical protein